MASFEQIDSDSTLVGKSILVERPQPQFGHFISYSDGGALKRVQLGGNGLVIGRTLPSDLIIANPEISRRHCRIELQGDWAMLSDLGSTNGTFIEGQKLERPMRLRDGSQFSLGTFGLRYERRDLREVAEAAELTADLKRAEDYVRAILPQPIIEGPVQADWCFVPSAKLGGDAFGYQFFGNDVFTGFLLDVSGHGIGSAMHAANVANTLRRRALPGVDFREPAQVAAGLNEVFPMEEHNGLMLTLWYFVYDVVGREMKYCAAGHHASFLLAPGAEEPSPLWQRGPAIGMLPFGKWATGNAVLAPGSDIFLFSDGVFEIVTKEGVQGDLEQFRKLLSPGVTPQALYEAVRAAARPGALDDDFSIVKLKL